MATIGYGLCGHQNVYNSGVRNGNWVRARLWRPAQWHCRGRFSVLHCRRWRLRAPAKTSRRSPRALFAQVEDLIGTDLAQDPGRAKAAKAAISTTTRDSFIEPRDMVPPVVGAFEPMEDFDTDLRQKEMRDGLPYDMLFKQANYEPEPTGNTTAMREKKKQIARDSRVANSYLTESRSATIKAPQPNFVVSVPDDVEPMPNFRRNAAFTTPAGRH